MLLVYIGLYITLYYYFSNEYVNNCLNNKNNIITPNVCDTYNYYNYNNYNKLHLLNKKKQDLYIWKNKINNVNLQFYHKNIRKISINYLNDINNQNHYYFWLVNNKINEIRKYNTIIFNLKTIFDYDKNELLNKEYLDNLSLFCHKNKIFFIIIAELHPNIFYNIQPKYFNKNNYYSPYNYKNKMFGVIQKLNPNEINDKASTVSINRIILDIINQYACNDNFIYIDNQKVENINTLIL
jgi:hypothetical protein